MKISKEIGFPANIRNAAQQLSTVYQATGNYQLALENYQLYVSMRDSINNEETEKASIKSHLKYEYEKKAAADSVAFAKETEIKNIEIDKQKAELKAKRNQQYGLFGGLFLILVFAAFMYNRFKVTQKQKTTIENQKNILDKTHHELKEKSKEITDSITYAKRIQEAILPSPTLLNQTLKNGFVLYQPKDIVSGDFYWMEKSPSPTLPKGEGDSPLSGELEGAVIYFAAADCTGHGVPGAMVSVVCSNALSKSVLEENKNLPGEILDKTREIVVKRFSKNNEDVKDGMDISLCGLDLNNSTLTWSGANNPLWIIRPSRHCGLDPQSVDEIPHQVRNDDTQYGNNRNFELIEIKPNKQPIGKVENHQPFTTHTIELQKGDTIYIFTDGFADQFGGEKGKKMMYKPFKELLLSIQEKTMDEQKEILTQHFATWKGNLEQVDDVCIIGVRI